MARDFYDDSYEEYDDYEEYYDNEECDEYDEYDDDEYEECDDYDDHGYEWTEEDSWDALTDGMYGDMPTDPVMYDAMMDAMGF